MPSSTRTCRHARSVARCWPTWNASTMPRADLGQLPLPDGAWLQIAGRLRQEGRLQTADYGSTRRWSGGRVAILAVAAALILAVGSSLLLLVRNSQQPTSPRRAASRGVAGDESTDGRGRADGSGTGAEADGDGDLAHGADREGQPAGARSEDGGNPRQEPEHHRSGDCGNARRGQGRARERRGARSTVRRPEAEGDRCCRTRSRSSTRCARATTPAPHRSWTG